MSQCARTFPVSVSSFHFQFPFPAFPYAPKQWNSGYQELLHLTNCPSLLNRCLYFKLCTLYRIVYDLVYFPPNVISPKHNSTSLVVLLHQPFAHTTAYYSSLFLLLYLYGTTCPLNPLLLTLFTPSSHQSLLSFSVHRVAQPVLAFCYLVQPCLWHKFLIKKPIGRIWKDAGRAEGREGQGEETEDAELSTVGSARCDTGE